MCTECIHTCGDYVVAHSAYIPVATVWWRTVENRAAGECGPHQRQHVLDRVKAGPSAAEAGVAGSRKRDRHQHAIGRVCVLGRRGSSADECLGAQNGRPPLSLSSSCCSCSGHCQVEPWGAAQPSHLGLAEPRRQRPAHSFTHKTPIRARRLLSGVDPGLYSGVTYRGTVQARGCWRSRETWTAKECLRHWTPWPPHSL